MAERRGMRPGALNQIVWKRGASSAPCALIPPHPFRWVLHDPQLGAKKYPRSLGNSSCRRETRSWLEICPQLVGNASAASWISVRSWLADFPQLAGRIRQLWLHGQLDETRRRLEIRPQLAGNKPAVHWKYLRSELEIRPQLAGRLPQWAGNMPAVGWKLFCTNSCAINGLPITIGSRLLYSSCFLGKDYRHHHPGGPELP